MMLSCGRYRSYAASQLERLFPSNLQWKITKKKEPIRGSRGSGPRTAARDLHSSRAGGRDDVSSQANSLQKM